MRNILCFWNGENRDTVDIFVEQFVGDYRYLINLLTHVVGMVNTDESVIPGVIPKVSTVV